MNVQGDQAPAKRQKMLKKFENSSTKTVTEQSMTSQIPLGSVMEILTKNTNMRTIEVKSVPQLLKNDQKQWCVNMSRAIRKG
jgi:hypothetical protein